MMQNNQFLDAKNLRLEKHGETLWLYTGGLKVALGKPRRALPLSQPDNFIILTDSSGNELGVLPHLEGMDAPSALLLARALKEAYAITTIARILDVARDPLTGQVKWRVEVQPEEDEAAIDSPLEGQSGPGRHTGHSLVPFPAGQSSAGQGLLRHPAISPEGAARTSSDGEGEETGRPLRLRLLKREAPTGTDDAYRQQEFTIGGTEDVQTARYPLIYIHDTEGNRYQITNCEALDLESRRAAERYF